MSLGGYYLPLWKTEQMVEARQYNAFKLTSESLASIIQAAGRRAGYRSGSMTAK